MKMERVNNYTVLSPVPGIQLSAQNVREYYYYIYEIDERTEALKSEGTGLSNTTLGVGNWIKPEVQVSG